MEQEAGSFDSIEGQAFVKDTLDSLKFRPRDYFYLIDFRFQKTEVWAGADWQQATRKGQSCGLLAVQR